MDVSFIYNHFGSGNVTCTRADAFAFSADGKQIERYLDGAWQPVCGRASALSETWMLLPKAGVRITPQSLSVEGEPLVLRAVVNETEWVEWRAQVGFRLLLGQPANGGAAERELSIVLDDKEPPVAFSSVHERWSSDSYRKSFTRIVIAPHSFLCPVPEPVLVPLVPGRRSRPSPLTALRNRLR